MEGKHEFVLKKAVAMFNKLTGKRLTTAEGGTFLDLYDIVDQHAAAIMPAAPAEPTPWERATAMSDTERQPGPVEVPTLLVEEPVPDVSVLEDAIRTGAGFAVVDAEGVKPVPREKVVAEPAKRYNPPPIRTHTRTHIPGYDWQIVVLDRERREENSYMVHFANRPSQDEFNEHFALFCAQTHYVHVNEWVSGDWQGITEDYRAHYTRPANPAEQPAPLPATAIVHEAKEPEPAKLVGRDVSKPALSDPWEEADKRFRVRYFSDATGGVTYFYVDKKPTGREMAHFHHTKCLAVVQARPAA